MENQDAPKTRLDPPRPEPTPTPTAGELSRIARDAVRQPADPRLDKELARMGLTDASEPAESHSGQPRGRTVAASPELERLAKELRRIKSILWVLVAATGILAVLVVLLFIR